MAKYAKNAVAQAKAWLGKKESDGTHREIIDIYNSHKPLARGYAVKYTDAWCSTFISAIAIKLGYTDIIPTECGCEKHIALFKKIGSWNESDGYIPSPGDIIFYDWDDSGKGENKGRSDHVGIVEKVSGRRITVIEGNYSDAVKRRTLSVNGRYIRGYGVPKYDTETKESSPKITVLDFQKAAIADGFSFPKYGADGIWGTETEKATKQAVVKKRSVYKYKNCTKLVQNAVGVTADGLCGKDTDSAIRAWQKKNGLIIDGAFGTNCWKKLLL